MALLIKNQIIKKLSKFVKNLSSNQINLSTLKGEGELSHIELDEKALEEVTEIPTWLKIKKANCNRVFIKQLDDVTIQMETCEELRNLNENETPGVQIGDRQELN
ncbi:unnamed protein product [Didymodactylos carnosus]|uniref:Uncharacterized protein n=1 Tax=Didymodactylos carnosus TaxID=1234261 RepID=A0A814Y674_9BILA|nr:unnamed protein product [Didymodactylos carnosus]CAF1225189.1 unnamed protein product [Didymodactylos carnosus]CAF3791236.1 unnamed protein product [Didymodactylos carnosus]CAF3988171.1 unnamed protein product [Didymodactylos carnosus]